MARIRFIEGNGIFLSPFSSNDYDLLFSTMNREDVRIFGRVRRDMITEEEAIEKAKQIEKAKEGFVICINETEERIGYCLLVNHDEINREAMLAITIKDPEKRGKGYGKEAIRLACKHGFLDLNLESIYLGVYEYNKQAIKAYESVGFKYVGRRRHSRIIGEKKYDEVIMDMILEEYQKMYGNDEMKKHGI